MSLDKLKETISTLIKDSIPVQTVWVEVTEVDWEEKTMTAIGIEDEVEYFEILLGIGAIDTKPKIGANCLIGIIDNNDTTPFLIMADEVEELDINVDNSQFNISGGFLLKKENETLKKIMVDLITAIRAMIFTTNNGPTIKLINDLQFEAIESRVKDFLK